VIPGDTVYL